MTQKNTATGKEYQAGFMKEGSRMDIIMIHALLDSLFTIFATMIRLKIQPASRRSNETIWQKEGLGLIGMKAEGACGSIALSFTLPAIRVISRSLLGHEIDSVNNEAADITGELTNMLGAEPSASCPKRA